MSYAQFYEDMHLLRCFEGQSTGFYIDIGAGHPVHSNVSFLYYLRGWRGITAEPNAWLSELSAAIRPRDHRVQSLVGAAPGQATYYLVEGFHGLSTTVPDLAKAAQREYGKSSETHTVAVTTLRALCEQHAPRQIDFLKIDVEGAEQAVLEGNDWTRFRPKVVMAEALVPITLAPAWEAWEPILTGNGYRFAFFDNLNRYYVAEEHRDLAARLADAPPSFEAVTQLFPRLSHAFDNAAHPDHHLARLLEGTDMVRLPMQAPDQLAALLTAGLPPADLKRRAKRKTIAAVHQRLFRTPPRPGWAESLRLQRRATIHDVYRRAVTTEAFRAACGRISASYAA
jgi:FkbM family methyltransferase